MSCYSYNHHRKNKPRRQYVNSAFHSLASLRSRVNQYHSQTRSDSFPNPSSHIRQFPYTTFPLQSNLAKSFSGICGRYVPQGWSTQGRRTRSDTEYSDGSYCNGWNDGWNENTDGHDDTANGYYGMDQFLLPRLRLESVSIHSLAFIHNTHPEIVKLPFPLTLGFKSMLQRGVETPDMDVRWVSSLSWYFLNFFGLNGLYRIILGSDNGKFNILDCSLCVVVVVGTILTAC